MITKKDLEFIRNFAINRFMNLGESKTLVDLDRPLTTEEKIIVSNFLATVNFLNSKGLAKVEINFLKDL